MAFLLPTTQCNAIRYSQFENAFSNSIRPKYLKLALERRRKNGHHFSRSIPKIQFQKFCGIENDAQIWRSNMIFASTFTRKCKWSVGIDEQLHPRIQVIVLYASSCEKKTITVHRMHHTYIAQISHILYYSNDTRIAMAMTTTDNHYENVETFDTLQFFVSLNFHLLFPIFLHFFFILCYRFHRSRSFACSMFPKRVDGCACKFFPSVRWFSDIFAHFQFATCNLHRTFRFLYRNKIR